MKPPIERYEDLLPDTFQKGEGTTIRGIIEPALQVMADIMLEREAEFKQEMIEYFRDRR